MIPAKFLKKYDRIIFEPDGVITTDSHFIACAVLAVYEMCHSNNYFGKSEMDCASVAANVKQICDLMLCGNKTKALLAEQGVSYPVDIAYVLLSVILGIGERRDFTNVYSYLKYIDLQTPDIFEHCAYLLEKQLPERDCKREGEVWQLLRKCYNEWLFGDELFEMYAEGVPLAHGKPSLILSDSLCVPIITLRDVLTTLLSAGKKISISTMRTRAEFYISVNRWKLNDYFNHENTITMEDVLEAGHTPNINTPHEPDIYSVARASIGPNYSEKLHLEGKYDAKFSRTLMVGAYPVSMFAAQTLGMGFAAVVHDPSDTEKKEMFRQLYADYILEGITELIQK